MRVAILAPISWRTPPRHYGPWEWAAGMLAGGLVEKGVAVTLYATGDSQTRARLRWVAPRPYSEDPELDPKVWECLHIAAVFEEAGRYELIHNHFDFLPLTYAGLVKTPVLTTIHGFSSPKILPVYKKYNGRVSYVAVSEADRHPDLNYLATIHHGIPVGEYVFSDRQGDYLLFLGRIHHDKGTHEAVRLARETGIPLVIAGIIQDRDYFDRLVAPYIDNKQIRYIGPIAQPEKGEVLAKAAALLHLINFNEPFGFSVVEAMACGTPVIAVRRGSMPELIVHGTTGFLVDNLEQAAGAVDRLGEIDRRACRRWVEENFSVELMVRRYLEVYQKILRERGVENA